jgi:hypothetical protein
MTSEDTPSATSSPGSGDGVSPSGSPGGQTLDLFGPAPAPASPSPRRGGGTGSKTLAISGRSSTGSSTSAALRKSLGSRLRVLTASSGSTLYGFRWKSRATPSGRLISALRALVRPTSGSGSGSSGWPTPCQQDGPHGGPGQGEDRLPGAVALAGWPTPRAAEAGPDYAIQDRERSGGYSLQTTAAMAGWTTPSARDWKDTGELKTRTEGKGVFAQRLDQLPRQANLAGWPTPISSDSRGSAGAEARKISELPNAVTLARWGKEDGAARFTAAGELRTGSSAEMEAGGPLNPAHSRWLMGYPPAWDDCAPTAMPSSRRLPPPSFEL